MKLHDFEPVDEGVVRPLAAHREESDVLTCGACGCRLTARESIGDGARYGPDAAWRHFPGERLGTDARGCRVGCADLPHRTHYLD